MEWRIAIRRRHFDPVASRVERTGREQQCGHFAVVEVVESIVFVDDLPILCFNNHSIGLAVAGARDSKHHDQW